ncbi:MAG: HAD hydrolase-like protein [Oscillospiraceae bacterium]|nr:HAD hydrolase-like protein [Oscillospiraceae bacterium]MBQ4644101.1 HAD hydrolase-like protein [Oscillospiraceae bacterium]
MTKYVLFDLDGTLNDPYEGITSCIKYALESVGIEENDPQKLRSYIGPPLRNTFALYGFNEEKCEELVKKYREKFLVEGIHQNIPYEGSREMLKALHEHGCKIALASCKPERACRIILEETGVLKYFDVVSGATEDKTLDTKPAIIKLSLERLGVSENELEHVYMVGDRDMDMIGAHENGAVAVGALYGYGDEKELTGAGADYLINNPLELLDIVLGKEDE